MNTPSTSHRIAFISHGLVIGLCVLLSAALLGAVAVSVEAEDTTRAGHAHVEDLDVTLASLEIPSQSPVLDRPCCRGHDLAQGQQARRLLLHPPAGQTMGPPMARRDCD